MKKILLQVPSRPLGNNRMFGPDINNVTETWRMLRDKLQFLGYEFTTADSNSVEGCGWILFLNAESVSNEHKKSWKWRLKKILGLKLPQIWPKRELVTEAEKLSMSDKLVFLIMEGKVICPRNYDPALWKHFNRILTWDDDIIDNKKFFKVHHPSATSKPIRNNRTFSERKFLVNIITNKTSSLPLELYTARRNTITYFDANYPEHFDLFGIYWNQPITKWQKRIPWLVKKYKKFQGEVPNKINTLSQYKFALCYENTEQNGYITEKIFDALAAKTVPIYLGAPNVADYIDEDVFIDRRKFKNEKELADYLFSVTEERYNEYLCAIERFLQSEKYKKFLPENFAETITKVLNLTKD